MSSEERKKHVLVFRSYKPSLEGQFKKPKLSVSKQSNWTCKRKLEQEVLIDRLEDHEKKSEKKSLSICKKDCLIQVIGQIFSEDIRWLRLFT